MLHPCTDPLSYSVSSLISVGPYCLIKFPPPTPPALLHPITAFQGQDKAALLGHIPKSLSCSRSDLLTEWEGSHLGLDLMTLFTDIP